MQLRRLVIIPAVLLVVIGLLFALQGIGLMKGSAMTGDPLWVVIGILAVIAGLILAWLALRTRQHA